MLDDNEENILGKYVERLTKRAVKWKFVRSAPTDYTWNGDFQFEGAGCFLVYVKEETDVVYQSIGRKKKKKPTVKPTGTYYIWCCGTDDTFMSKRKIPNIKEAMDLYDLIFDGVSRTELESIGFGWD